MAKQNFVKYDSDYETTVDDDTSTQDATAVWAATLVKLDDPDDPSVVDLYKSLPGYMQAVLRLAKRNSLAIAFHNLKFDGSFILVWLLSQGDYKLARNADGRMMDVKDFYREAPNKSYIYTVSARGQWYMIQIKYNGHIVKFFDSLKLLPFPLKTIGKSFGTKHQKLEMDYTGKRYPGCNIKPAEVDYIKNDALVLKEGLNFMSSKGMNKLTIGACCMSTYKAMTWNDSTEFRNIFPNLAKQYTGDEVIKDGKRYVLSYDDLIRRSYHGGWCYVKKGCEDRVYKPICVCDVNSLYPSMMQSESGNRYPVGRPMMFHVKHNKLPKECFDEKYYYFIEVSCSFVIKPGMLPTVQIKNDPRFYGREWLESSDYVDGFGCKRRAIVKLMLTMTDWELMQEHYTLDRVNIHRVIIFRSALGLFDDYINTYAQIKMESKGAMRQLAKLMLNNLYGKFATSDEADYKEFHLDEDGLLKSEIVRDNDRKKCIYIPVGSAITSYARRFTIRAAQANYDTFLYSDTDSIHCNCTPDEIKGAPEDPVKFNHWKYESQCDFGLYVRQKTYIEHMVAENREPVDPYWTVRCAGMSARAKQIFIASFTRDVKDLAYFGSIDESKTYNENITKLLQDKKVSEAEANDLKVKRDVTDFKIGLTVSGNLKPRQVKGGTLLTPQPYCMHENGEVLFHKKENTRATRV